MMDNTPNTPIAEPGNEHQPPLRFDEQDNASMPVQAKDDDNTGFVLGYN